jgi:hypothetical protein
MASAPDFTVRQIASNSVGGLWWCLPPPIKTDAWISPASFQLAILNPNNVPTNNMSGNGKQVTNTGTNDQGNDYRAYNDGGYAYKNSEPSKFLQ